MIFTDPRVLGRERGVLGILFGAMPGESRGMVGAKWAW